MSSIGIWWPGVPMALASAALFGAGTPFAKALLGRIDPWVLAGGVAGPLLLMLGLAATAASTASLLLNLEAIATMAIAWLIFRENVDRRVLAGAAAIVAGAAILSWQGSAAGLSWGTIAIVGACLALAVDNNLTRKIAAADPVQIAAVKGLAAGSTNLALALLLGAEFPYDASLFGAALVGVLGYGVSLVLFMLALRHLGTARTGAYFATAPFIGTVTAVGLLAEPVTLELALAGALMACGVWLHMAERHAHPHVHEPLVHEHRHVHDDHHGHEHGPDDPPGKPHSHRHRHEPLVHSHPHYPDIHHRHAHGTVRGPNQADA